MTTDQFKRVTTAASSAVQSETETGVPAELTLAQYILESGYGAHCPGNNPFGIKAAAGHPGQQLQTGEHEGGADHQVAQVFEVFPTLTAAFDRHGALLSKGTYFRSAFEQYRKDNDLRKFVHGVALHYATDPGYEGKLLEIMSEPDFRAALAIGRRGTVAA